MPKEPQWQTAASYNIFANSLYNAPDTNNEVKGGPAKTLWRKLCQHFTKHHPLASIISRKRFHQERHALVSPVPFQPISLTSGQMNERTHGWMERQMTKHLIFGAL